MSIKEWDKIDIDPAEGKMSFFVAVFIILLLSFDLSFVFKKKISDCLPMSAFIVIVFLYLFYICNHLYVGMVAFVCLISLSSIYCVFKAARNHKYVLSSLFQPAILIFLVYVIFIYFYTNDYHVILWDEERLWGAVPKAMHTTGKLQLGNDAEIFEAMQSYPPGMMLFEFFLTAFSKQFFENQLFAGYAVFVGILFMPAMRDLKWKQWPLVMLCLSAVILIPCVFTCHFGDYSEFYLSLFIDPILGMLAGYAFFEAVFSPFSSWFKTLRFGLTLFVLTEIKDSGMEFSCFAWITAMVIYYMDHDKMNHEKNGKVKAVQMISTIFLMVFPFLSWRLLLIRYGVSNHIPFSLLVMDATSIKCYLTAAVNQTMISTRNLFGYYFPDYCFSLFESILICVAAGVLCTAIFKDLKCRVFIVSQAVMALAFVLFIYGYLCAFNDATSHGEFPSFKRYMASLIGCAGTFEIMRLITCLTKVDFSIKKKRIKYLLSLPTAAICIILLCFTYRTIDIWSWNRGEYLDVIEAADGHSSLIKEKIELSERKNRVRVCEIISGSPTDNMMLHQRIAYDLIGSGIQMANYYPETRIAEVDPDSIDLNDICVVQKYGKIWCDRLIEQRMDYVYLASSEKWTEEIFKELGVKGDPVDQAMYKIEPDSSCYGIKLLQVT